LNIDLCVKNETKQRTDNRSTPIDLLGASLRLQKNLKNRKEAPTSFVGRKIVGCDACRSYCAALRVVECASTSTLVKAK
jgi:hypothetical protein